eukprot:3258515-Pyramimonas_sp.AAC.1
MYAAIHQDLPCGLVTNTVESDTDEPCVLCGFPAQSLLCSDRDRHTAVCHGALCVHPGAGGRVLPLQPWGPAHCRHCGMQPPNTE